MALVNIPRPTLNDNVMNPRLVREQAKSGDVTASLVWNGHSDLDLHADVILKSGSRDHIYYSSKKGIGGALDVDANAGGQKLDDPVENIYWDKPPAGTFRVWVHNYNRCGPNQLVPYRVALKLPDQELNFEGELADKQKKTCFCFKVDDAGSVEVCDADMVPAVDPVASVPAAGRQTSRSRRALRRPAAAALTAPPARAKGVAKGKKAKALVMAGTALKTAGRLKKEHLMVSKTGKVVSKKASAASKARYANTLRPWIEACKAAKAALGLTGFVAMRKESDVYKKAREIYDAQSK